MLTVVIETSNQAEALARTLSSLVGGAVEGIVREVLVHDLGSTDGTERVAEHAGCRIVTRGALREGLGRAKGDWLLFLEPGARLADGWIDAVRDHVETGRGPARFTPSTGLWRRLLTGTPLAAGLLIARSQALDRLAAGDGPAAFARRIRATRLAAQVVTPTR